MLAVYRKQNSKWSVIVVFVSDEYPIIAYSYRWDPDYQIRRIS